MSIYPRWRTSRAMVLMSVRRLLRVAMNSVWKLSKFAKKSVQRLSNFRPCSHCAVSTSFRQRAGVLGQSLNVRFWQSLNVRFWEAAVRHAGPRDARPWIKQLPAGCRWTTAQ